MWPKEITPSNELRKWFHADKEKRHASFVKKYSKELSANKALKTIRTELRKHTTITLVTAAKDMDMSHVPVLRKRL